MLLNIEQILKKSINLTNERFNQNFVNFIDYKNNISNNPKEV